MKHTKGQWIIDYGGTIGHIKAVSPEGTPTVCRYAPPPSCAPSIPEEEQRANAQLIAQAPRMLGQLETGAGTLIRVQQIIVDVAKPCSPEVAERMAAIQAYVSGVIAGNEIAIDQATK